jgi:acyl carrier protein
MTDSPVLWQEVTSTIQERTGLAAAYNPWLWQEVTSVIEEMTDIKAESLTPEQTFEELGFDSLTTVEIAVAAEERFGVNIADEELLALSTLGEVVAYIEGLVTPDAPLAAVGRR